MDLIVRAAWLFALATVPKLVSPDPAPPFPLLGAVVAIGVLAGLPAFAWLLRRRVETGAATAAVVLSVIASLVALLVAASFGQGNRPLGAGAAYVALPLWAAFACAASAAAGEWLGSSFRNKRYAGAIAVIVLGVYALREGGSVLASDDAMWSAALRRDPGHEIAAERVVRSLVSQGKNERARGVATRCLEARPASEKCKTLLLESSPRPTPDGGP